MKTESRYKRPTKRSKFFVAPALWDHAISFCRCYPIWIAELAVCDTSKTITDYADQIHVQTSGEYNPVEEMAIRRATIQRKVDIVNDAALAASGDEIMQKYLILGVTHHLSYETLSKQNIPCGRRQYHRMRREMIYYVSQRI